MRVWFGHKMVTNSILRYFPVKEKTTVQCELSSEKPLENLERAMGIEPTSQPWQGRVLPLNHARALYLLILAKITRFFKLTGF